MVLNRKYNLVNNVTGWGVFIIALITYWLTLEPTASYWDCGEFIIQADKLEIGHPPGNPIFMLTARFFANFAFGDITKVAVMVNAMSGLLSALTILLLFWTITHLVRRLIVRDDATELSLGKYLTIMGSGVCGALAYTWSDTFWFSAVEGEVYAFSSFCTALVVWLILKWENRADQPRSDRYLILIAYIIGVSIAVHLLNLLCIPALVLVYCYRKVPDMNVKKSLLALLVGFAIIVLVLYGLVPGFIKVAGWFELLAVNYMHLSFNMGLMVYVLLTVCSFCWALYELYSQHSNTRIRISFLLSTFFSGILFIGSGVWFGVILYIVLIGVLFFIFRKKLPLRWLNVAMWSIAVIFVGYSSYALILIRSNAQTPMNQNAPNNVFDLSSYLNREQYGEVPLLYGETFESTPMQKVQDTEQSGVQYQQPVGYVLEKGKPRYAKGVHSAKVVGTSGFLTEGDYKRAAELAKREGDFYAMYDYEMKPVMVPELNILLPRIHSSVPSHQAAYKLWVPDLVDNPEYTTLSAYDVDTQSDVPLMNEQPQYDEESGDYYFTPVTAQKPTFKQNMQFFFSYQLNHMYWRYFLWNFAGRQNDICNQMGELDAGNWISGIPFIDNSRLGDQSLLPAEYGKDNPGHNVFFMLPLLMGIFGLLWQAFKGKRGIEQFWVVFFLFFMTGIAIVLYLNQPPLQPRERDYAFAGSFYAFAIWIGMGVAAIDAFIKYMMLRNKASKKPAAAVAPATISAEAPGEADHSTLSPKHSMIAAGIACLIGLLIPLQMVSQTWDDHDRSNRYAARDYAINYLNSLEPNAIVFCNGDNDTFPLWYAQEVEGVRPDVKIINLSYLNSEWYANQQRLQTYTAAPVDYTVTPEKYAYGNLSTVGPDKDFRKYMDEQVPLLQALKEVYDEKSVNPETGNYTLKHLNTYIPVDAETVRKRGLVPEGVEPIKQIPVELKPYTYLGNLLMLDIIATNAANGWQRPIYWCCTVGEDNYSQFLPYVRKVGMVNQLVPYRTDMDMASQDPEYVYSQIGQYLYEDDDNIKLPGMVPTNTDRGFKVISNYLWGGADNVENPPYFDETAGRMLAVTRMSLLDLSASLIYEGIRLNDEGLTAKATAKFNNAKTILQTYDKRLSNAVRPASLTVMRFAATDWGVLAYQTRNKQDLKKALQILETSLVRFAQNVKYVNMICDRFGVANEYGMRMPAAQLTPENSTIMKEYYQLILLYNVCSYMYDNDFRKQPYDEISNLLPQTKKALKKAGISDNMMQRIIWYCTPAKDDEGAAIDNGDADYISAEGIAQFAEIVTHLQSLSEAEYAQASEYERQVDSVFIGLVEEYVSAGGDIEELYKYPNIDKVDAERSQRLYDAFVAAHPDQVQ
ncbi:MAG: DUF2723 domain-containing protein [Muribaculaceae bacterium]|nr:DUF2723 domain-containing protein [Muribaculaceae bacterium]